MSDSKIIDLDNVINVIEREDTDYPEPQLVVMREDRPYCPHNHLNIFKHHRKIYCKDCGAKLDPFDAILSFSSKGNSVLSNIKWLNIELKQKQQEKENLIREITNLKAQKRNHAKR